MKMLINASAVRKEILKRADAGPNEARRRLYADCPEEPKLYDRVSMAVLEEIDSRVRLIVKEIVACNSAGSKGKTIK
jgi:hypothetical protein